MSNNSIISILHISDFHYSRSKWRDQEVVVNALIKDIKELCIGHRQPDLIIFTGDLVHGADKDSHSESFDNLLEPLLVAGKCSSNRLVIAPGNHDLSRVAVEKLRNDHEVVRDSANDPEKINELFETGHFGKLKIKFFNYNELDEYLDGGRIVFTNDFVRLFRISDINIEIVVVNTALASVGGLKEYWKDESHLVIPGYALLDAAKHFDQNCFRIFAHHHPTSHLSETSARILKSFVQEYGNLQLFGHMHDPQAEQVTNFKGDLFQNQAGAIYTQRGKYYIGYSLISLDMSSNQYEMHIRSYFDERKIFDDGLDRLPEGRFYSSQASREFWRTIARPVDEDRFRMQLKGSCLTEFTSEVERAADDVTLDKFIAPPLKRSFVKNSTSDDAPMTRDVQISFDELIDSDSSEILYAPSEYGRTTVLRQIQYRMLQGASDLKVARLPVLVEFSEIKNHADYLVRLVKSRAYSGDGVFDVESLLKLGRVCLIVDDVIFEDGRRMGILREFVLRFPKNRYVLSSPKSAVLRIHGAYVDPQMPVNFGFLEVCVLRRKDMRQLVEVICGSSRDVDRLLDHLHSEFQEINLPFTAANGTILMIILEAHSDFRPVNRSVLIEQFVDASLRKSAPDQSRRETFDYGNKTALLAHIAGVMARTNIYVYRREELREIMKKYIEQIGIHADLEVLFNEFLACRIFIGRPDDRFGFRYRAVLEYFISMEMFSDVTFRDWIWDESRYLSYSNEIQYYAGKLRKDNELMDDMGRRFKSLLEAAIDALGIPIDLFKIQKLLLPPIKATDVSFDHLSSQLSRPLTAEEKDAFLEDEIPRDIENRQDAVRPEISDPTRKLLASLFLYSGLLKNFELIPDAEKRRHLMQIWSGWSAFLQVGLSLIAELVRRRRIKHGGAVYELKAPFAMKDAELLRLVALTLPTGVSRLISVSLGTEKLERQLVEPQLSETEEPLIFEFFRASLIADLRLGATAHALQTALERLSSSPYLLESLVWKIADIRRMNRLSEEAYAKISPPLSGAIANLRGGTKQQREDEKRRVSASLKREEVLLKIRRQNDEL